MIQDFSIIISEIKLLQSFKCGSGMMLVVFNKGLPFVG